jgi:tetratricopeptide (TPR) repeat protein
LLELAHWYEDVGCIEEAITLLELSKPHAMVYFKLAYLYNEINDKNSSDTYLEKAVRSSSDFVFPFRMENVAVLNWAAGQTDSWRPKYYLALLNWSLGNEEEAKEFITKCGDSPDYPYFFLAKASLFKGKTGYDGEGDLIKARELGIEDWRTSEELIEYYLVNTQVDRALDIAKESITKFPSNDVLKYVYAKCLMADKQYSACKEALAKTTILPSEGARYGRTTYRQACMMESIEFYGKGKYSSAIKSAEQARLWPENLGAGQPYDVDERIEDFFKAECLSKKGKVQQAEGMYQNVLSFTEQQKLRYSSTSYLYLIALGKMNKKDQILKYLNQWEQSKPNDPLQKWSKSMIEKDFDNAQKIESQINTMTGGTPWDPKFADPEFEIVKAIGKVISSHK